MLYELFILCGCAYQNYYCDTILLYLICIQGLTKNRLKHRRFIYLTFRQFYLHFLHVLCCNLSDTLLIKLVLHCTTNSTPPMVITQFASANCVITVGRVNGILIIIVPRVRVRCIVVYVGCCLFIHFISQQIL